MAASGKRKKAKRVARAKKRIKKQQKNIKKTGPDAGPVSLAEAKALAQAKDPKLEARAARKGAAPPASPAPVGA